MAMDFLHALSGVFSLLLIVVLGCILSWKYDLPPQVRSLLPRFVTNITLPLFLFCTIAGSTDREALGDILSGVALPFVTVCCLFCVAWLMGLVIGVDRRHFGLFCACVSNSNTIYIGIPVNMALFGAVALPYVLLYYFASTTFFWTFGNYFIARDNPATCKKGMFKWRKIISPPIIGFVCGLLCVEADITPQGPIFAAAKSIGDLTTPLSLLFIGMALQAAGITGLRFGRDVIAATLGRMVLSPLLMWAAVRLFEIPPLMGQVFIIQSALPVLTQAAILSAYYNTDPEYGSEMVGLTTMLCAITVPVIMILI